MGHLVGSTTHGFAILEGPDESYVRHLDLILFDSVVAGQSRNDLHRDFRVPINEWQKRRTLLCQEPRHRQDHQHDVAREETVGFKYSLRKTKKQLNTCDSGRTHNVPKSDNLPKRLQVSPQSLSFTFPFFVPRDMNTEGTSIRTQDNYRQRLSPEPDSGFSECPLGMQRERSKKAMETASKRAPVNNTTLKYAITCTRSNCQKTLCKLVHSSNHEMPTIGERCEWRARSPWKATRRRCGASSQRATTGKLLPDKSVRCRGGHRKCAPTQDNTAEEAVGCKDADSTSQQLSSCLFEIPFLRVYTRFFPDGGSGVPRARRDSQAWRC